MLAEADRIGYVRSFWWTRPIYLTRGYAPVPGVYGETAVGAGLVYALSTAPPAESVCVYVDGLLMQPNGFDYTLVGGTLTFNVAPDKAPYVSWQATVNVATNASDQIQYGSEVYRVLQVYYDPGGGYHKALATRMSAA